MELFNPTCSFLTLELLSLYVELLAHSYPSLGIPTDSTKHAITLFILALVQAASTILTFLTPPFHRAKTFHGDFIRAFFRKSILALLVVCLDDGFDDEPPGRGALLLLDSTVPSCLIYPTSFVV